MKKYSITSKQLEYLENIARAYVYNLSSGEKLSKNLQKFERCIKDIKERELKEKK